MKINVGDKLFVPDKKHISDHVTGGEATVSKVLQGGDYVKMGETEDIQWHTATLLRNQNEYKKQYANQNARYYSEPFERDNFLW